MTEQLPEDLPEPDVRNDAVPLHDDDPEQTDDNVPEDDATTTPEDPQT